MKLKCILAQPIYLNEPRLQVIKESTQGILTPPSKLIFIQVVSKEILITFLNPFYIQLLFISLDVLLWMNPLFLCIYLFLLKESANFILSYALFNGTAGVKDQTVSFTPYWQCCCRLFLVLGGYWRAGYSWLWVDSCSSSRWKMWWGLSHLHLCSLSLAEPSGITFCAYTLRTHCFW